LPAATLVAAGTGRLTALSPRDGEPTESEERTMIADRAVATALEPGGPARRRRGPIKRHGNDAAAAPRIGPHPAETRPAGRLASAARSNGGRRWSSAVVAAVLAVAMAGAWPGPGAAQSSASFRMPRQSVDGGGGPANSASYTIDGSIGQPDAGSTTASASYTVRGGFQRAAAAASPPDRLFANGFESP
jgi:hypothetical protein